MTKPESFSYFSYLHLSNGGNNPKEGYHGDKVIRVFLKIFLCKCEACLQVIFLVLLWLNFILQI